MTPESPPPPLRRRGPVLAAALALSAAAAGPALAQDGGRLVGLLGIRSATVAPDGLAFGAVALTTLRREAEGVEDGSADGSIILGFGLGSAADAVGVQVTANIISLTDDFADSGSLGVKASREVGRGALPVYLGVAVDRIGGWGDSEDLDPSVSGMVTAFPQVDAGGRTLPLMVTLGAGTHLRNDFEDPGVFGGVGVGLTRNLGASAAWTGESVSVGAVFRVPGLDNMRFTASLDDAFDQVDARRVTVTATVFVRDLWGG